MDSSQVPALGKAFYWFYHHRQKRVINFFYGGHFQRQDITRAHDILRQDMHGAAKSLQVQVKNNLFLKIRHRNPEISPHKQNKRTIRVHFFVVFKPFLVLSIFLTWTFLVTKDNAVYSIFSQERYNVTKNSQANVKNYFCWKINPRKSKIYPHHHRQKTWRTTKIQQKNSLSLF